ncbi:hypothetical protein KIW84_064090 [Lathyrus oleraceus]|uniref:Rab3-GAP regulatory subunit N-terminal domain-containing protein n=1 Tax=Pisum sativum TaxID=3888 RepID=A0A9D4WBT6_PEA|nr:hypothetical protein KIW84_064090 [Pisum sativum]
MLAISSPTCDPCTIVSLLLLDFKSIKPIGITQITSENTSPQKSPKKSAVKPQPFARASPLTCIKDHPRKGEKLTSSPSGTLAAITGSLGRILLLDTQALVVVRLWKGYRDVSCLFMEMLP